MKSMSAEQALAALAEFAPDDVCRRAVARYVSSENTYVLSCFGQEFRAHVGNAEIVCDTPVGGGLLKQFGVGLEACLLNYLVYVKDEPPSGQLIKPSSLPGGDIYVKGTHALPLDALAERYGADPDALLRRGTLLGGIRAEYGDASMTVRPFPHLPLTAIVWRGDDEFPANADLLFDATARLHLPAEMLYNTAVLTTRAFLCPLD
jgi:hypothetical protein